MEWYHMISHYQNTIGSYLLVPIALFAAVWPPIRQFPSKYQASVHDLDQAAEEDVLQRAFTKVPG